MIIFQIIIFSSFQGPVDIQVKKVLQDILVRMVVRDYQDILVTTDHKVRLDNKVHLDLLV